MRFIGGGGGRHQILFVRDDLTRRKYDYHRPIPADGPEYVREVRCEYAPDGCGHMRAIDVDAETAHRVMEACAEWIAEQSSMSAMTSAMAYL
jgi:hypothetical protein